MQGKRPPIPDPPADLATAYEDFHDHATFARESLAIRNKHGAKVPFVLQPAQIKLNKIIEDCRRRRKPVRIIVLKARQVMVSAGVAAEYFHVIPFNPGQKARIIAHTEDSAKDIFSYYHQFTENYESFRGIANLPAVVKDAEDAGIVEYANGSRFQIQTANSVEGGRGGSYRFLHFSEYAFYRNARRLLTGIMQTVPDDADTMVIIESTANGVGDDFHQKWQQASDPSSESEWIAFFFAWWEHPEYTMALVDPAAFQASLSEEESELQTKYNLTLAQLNWRRWAIRNKCQSSVDIFKQEYPACPEEAFLFSGRPRFPHQSLAKMPIDREGLVGELQEEILGPKSTLIFLPSGERGALTVYKKPSEHKQYSIGIDVAEGIDAGEGVLGNIDPDYSVADVLDRNTGEQVAQLRGRIEPGPFGEYVAALGRWYNWAYLVPEANGPGIAVLEELMRQNYPPGQIYHRRPQPDEIYASGNQNTLQKMGWRTSAVSKIQLLSTLDQAIRDFTVLIRNPGTLSECQTFVYKPNGKMQATEGCHDDRVISLALAVLGVLVAPHDPSVSALKKFQPPHLAGGTVRTYGKRRNADRGTTVRLA